MPSTEPAAAIRPAIAWQLAKQYGDILYDKAEGIAKITINRPAPAQARRASYGREEADG